MHAFLGGGLVLWGAIVWAGAPPSVNPLEDMRACRVDADCVVVSNSCNGCCQQAVINKVQRARFAKKVKDDCQGYRGSVCECVAERIVPVCKRGACTAG